MKQNNSIEETILSKIVEFVGMNEAEAAELTYDSAIFGTSTGGVSIGIDSLSTLELAVEIYETWGVDVPIEDMMKFDTVSSIADYIRSHIDDNDKK